MSKCENISSEVEIFAIQMYSGTEGKFTHLVQLGNLLPPPTEFPTADLTRYTQ